MAFESVKENGVIWNPCTTGKKKDNNLKQLDINDKSFLIGYFTGTKTISGGTNGDSTIHKFIMKEVGNKEHLVSEVAEGEEVSVWGTGVLNDQMSSVTPGAFTKITLTGKVIAKTSGNPYYTWDVAVDESVDPLSGTSSFSADEAPKEAGGSPEPAVKAGQTEEEESDLPF